MAEFEDGATEVGTSVAGSVVRGIIRGGVNPLSVAADIGIGAASGLFSSQYAPDVLVAIEERMTQSRIQSVTTASGGAKTLVEAAACFALNAFCAPAALAQQAIKYEQAHRDFIREMAAKGVSGFIDKDGYLIDARSGIAYLPPVDGGCANHAEREDPQECAKRAKIAEALIIADRQENAIDPGEATLDPHEPTAYKTDLLTRNIAQTPECIALDALEKMAERNDSNEDIRRDQDGNELATPDVIAARVKCLNS